MIASAMVEGDFVMIESTDIPNVAASKDYLKVIDEHIESLNDDLRHISLAIHDNPELQYKEYHAHKVLTEYLKKQDWKVTPSAYGIETAFVAVYDTGKKGPVVSFNAEYGRA
jgi:metal-dependent amidase/aminoacylase/carboxypeptidase family protein